MQFIRTGGVHDISDHAGMTTIRRLLEKGWIEPDMSGQRQYRVTPAGESAIRTKIPE
jgi:predicted transcriptional regulator